MGDFIIFNQREISGKDKMAYQGLKWRNKEIKFHKEKID